MNYGPSMSAGRQRSEGSKTETKKSKGSPRAANINSFHSFQSTRCISLDIKWYHEFNTCGRFGLIVKSVARSWKQHAAD